MPHVADAQQVEPRSGPLPVGKESRPNRPQACQLSGPHPRGRRTADARLGALEPDPSREQVGWAWKVKTERCPEKELAYIGTREEREVNA